MMVFASTVSIPYCILEGSPAILMIFDRQQELRKDSCGSKYCKFPPRMHTALRNNCPSGHKVILIHARALFMKNWRMSNVVNYT